MTEPNELYAYFTVVGEFDPPEISSVVGVRPTESWRKGDLNPKTHYERKFSRWSLYSKLDRHRCLEEHIADVLEQMRVNQAAFSEVSAKYGGVMQLAGYFKTDYPGLSFGHELVKGLGVLPWRRLRFLLSVFREPGGLIGMQRFRSKDGDIIHNAD